MGMEYLVYQHIGKYTVNETFCPSNELNPVKEFNVIIDRDSDGVIKELVENDTPFQSYIKLVKIDKNTGKKVTFNNTTFSLYKLNKENNEWEQVSCKLGKESYNKWTTDDNATAYTETKLNPGIYKVDEIVVADGFLQLEEECIFEINRDNETLEYDKDYDAYITVNIGNEQPTGTLKINKNISLRDDVDLSLIEDIDYTKISFELIAKENIIDYADGSVIYKKGQSIGVYNLNDDATLIVKDLPMGEYQLFEKSFIDGTVNDKTIHDVTFTQKDHVTKEYIVELDIENKTTCIELSKTDITGDKELEGATLSVKDKNGNIIDRWVSGKETHKIEGLIVDEKYTLTEEIQVENYVKATDIEFIVKNTEEIQKVVMIDKMVEVIKTDFVTGEEIEGAELQVVDENGNIIDEWISTREPHIVRGLEENKTYKLIEKISPYGYEIAEEITFTVTQDKETQKIEMKDMPILTDVQLIKIDAETKERICDDFVFGIYKDENCTELIEEVKSDKETATITFRDLRYNTFYIKEISSPDNYQLSDRVIKLEINDKGVFVNDIQLPKEENKIYSFEFENTKIETPNTGDNSNIKLWIAVLIVSCILLIAFFIIFIKKFMKK